LLHEFRLDQPRVSRGSVGIVATAVVWLRHERTGASRALATALWHRGGATALGCAAEPRSPGDFLARQDALHAAADNGGVEALEADLNTWFQATPVSFAGVASRRRDLQTQWLVRLLTAHGGGVVPAEDVLASLLRRAARSADQRAELLEAAVHLLDLSEAVGRSSNLERAQEAWYHELRGLAEPQASIAALGLRLGFADRLR
jgi:hypothetical protein